MEILNKNYIENETEEIGGLAKCIAICASLCVISDGIVTAMAAAGTVM